MSIRFSTWVDGLVAPVTSLTSEDKIAVITNAPETRSISRDNLVRSVFAAVLTSDGDLVTRAGGNPERITRTALAGDAAFTTRFLQQSVLNADNVILTRTAGAPAAITRSALFNSMVNAVLTADGQLLTRVAGSPSSITRASLASDAEFVNRYVERTILTMDGDLFTRDAGIVTRVSRSALADDPVFTSKYLQTVNAQLRNLNDVDVLGATSGSLLTYDGTNWVHVTRANLVTDSNFTAAFAPRTPVLGSLAGSGTVNLDMNALRGTYQSISATNNITFTTSNRAAGRTVTIRIIASGGNRTINFNSSWVFISPIVKSTSWVLAAGKTAILTLTFFGTGDGDAVAAWAVQS
jgi:hypothetical protein